MSSADMKRSLKWPSLVCLTRFGVKYPRHLSPYVKEQRVLKTKSGITVCHGCRTIRCQNVLYSTRSYPMVPPERF